MDVLHCLTVLESPHTQGYQVVTKITTLYKLLEMSNQESPLENRVAQWIEKELDRLPPGPPSAGVTSNTELPKASAVILNWSRFSNVLVIVASLSRTEGIEEILIWNNNPQNLSREEGPS